MIAALSTDDKGDIAAFSGQDGTALARAFEEIIDSRAAANLTVARADYAELFHATIGDRVVRRPENRDVRAHIYGLLEARLQSVDRIVLGGLNEGTWPPRDAQRSLAVAADAPSRSASIRPSAAPALSAHDFAQALGTGEVILARAAKVAGSPTVTSRFVQRIAALAGERWKAAVVRGDVYLKFARALDAPVEVKHVERPAPKPPRAARPSKLSVTAIEDWLRDPYTIYARYVLGWPRSTPSTRAPARATAAPSSTMPSATTPKILPAGFRPIRSRRCASSAKNTSRRSTIIRKRAPSGGRASNASRAGSPDWDKDRRAGLTTLHAEIRGELSFPVGARQFTLSGIADRIERRLDGTYAIIDYKTGQARTEKQVRTGLAPQLTLEAAILRAGGFKPIASGSVSEIAYVTLKGGEPAGKPEAIKFKDGTPDSQADRALDKLKGLAATFEDESTPYLSLVHPMWKTHYGDYDHLARVKEWSLTGGADEGES